MFMLRRLVEEYHDEGKKLYISFVDMEKAFDIVPEESVRMGNDIDGNTKSLYYISNEYV